MSSGHIVEGLERLSEIRDCLDAANRVAEVTFFTPCCNVSTRRRMTPGVSVPGVECPSCDKTYTVQIREVEPESGA